MINNYQLIERHSNVNQFANAVTNNFFKTLTMFFVVCLLFGMQSLSATERPASVENKKSVSVDSPNQAITFRYDVEKFKSGEFGLSKPVVSVPGGTFSYVRDNVDTYGGLAINTVNGWISHKNSDPGKYIVTYTYKSTKISVTVIVE